MNPDMLMQNARSLYDEDFVVWTEEMVQALEQRNLEALDWENLLLEVQALGQQDKRELESRLLILLTNLLIWQYHCDRPSALGHLQNSWVCSIAENRDQIQRLLKQSPSLQKTLANALDSCYQKARKQASRETGLEIQIFPEACEYTQAQILNDDFLPGVL